MTKTDVDRIETALPDLRTLTPARVLLGRHGAGMPTGAAQAFLLDHARARQAVWSEIDRKRLRNELAGLRSDIIEAESQAGDRSTYVRRPDLGRLLSPESGRRLVQAGSTFDIAIIVGDGLSASAVAINAAPMVCALHSEIDARGLTLAPIVLAANARVALADPIGQILKARISIMLIGERPGLSAADSMGIYITYRPETGTPDSRRNCISNIRDGGLSIENAVVAVMSLVSEILSAGASGVALARMPAEKAQAIAFNDP